MQELEENLREVQRFNVREVERLQMEHESEMKAVSSRHDAELDNLLLINKQLEETGQEVDKETGTI